MTRYLIALFLAAGLTGCGFHLRNKLELPADMPSVKVESTTRYSELVKLLSRGLRSSGVSVVDDEAPVAEDSEGVARLVIRSERWGDRPIAIDERGRSQEYSMRYAVVFGFNHPDGTAVVPEQVIELSRDYVSQPEDDTGTATEREILADELRREMSASILRRIDSVVRANLEKSNQLQPAAGSKDGQD
ncbi:LPS assembly lipoprotein LptE [Stenotrophomonas sp.]|uniref:LPS-assembly lipoprotein LptE n=1 Tax=Stenotrophomonas sp. TaxID=69392 RepID=UPI0028A8BC77|nr:LPS assembly lipoprotein LptE [Stenotrophomonas sp.]